MAPSFWTSQGAPASSSPTSAPASDRTLAAIPPPAPEPTMQTSKVLVLVAISIGECLPRASVRPLGRRVYRLRAPARFQDLRMLYPLLTSRRSRLPSRL